MEDIDFNTERKYPFLINPWIIGLVVIVILIPLAYYYFQDDGAEVKLYGNQTAISKPVGEYLKWSESIPQDYSSITQEFTKDGIVKMAEALTSISKGVKGIDRDELSTKLNRIKISSVQDSLEQAKQIKQAFLVSSDVMVELQKTAFPGLQEDVNLVKEKIETMDTIIPGNQKKQLKDVFIQTAVVLKKMDQENGSGN